MKKGYRKPRKVRPREKDLPSGYDSNWEYKLHVEPLQDWSHHGEKIAYTVDHTYEPDFRRTFNGVEYLLEAKGRFWDHAEYSKYIWIRKSLKENQELIFIFAQPQAAMPAAKKRKNGTKRSHAEWADTNDFTWYSEYNLPKEWTSEYGI
jgi:hypothetical protein|tara:strand:+ start:640 stop:1086 length:447 start_codon:yes stop_codon:yes gene_type:complete